VEEEPVDEEEQLTEEVSNRVDVIIDCTRPDQ
jgi:hypothetical protein